MAVFDDALALYLSKEKIDWEPNTILVTWQVLAMASNKVERSAASQVSCRLVLNRGASSQISLYI